MKPRLKRILPVFVILLFGCIATVVSGVVHRVDDTYLLSEVTGKPGSGLTDNALYILPLTSELDPKVNPKYVDHLCQGALVDFKVTDRYSGWPLYYQVDNIADDSCAMASDARDTYPLVFTVNALVYAGAAVAVWLLLRPLLRSMSVKKQ